MTWGAMQRRKRARCTRNPEKEEGNARTPNHSAGFFVASPAPAKSERMRYLYLLT